MDWTLRFWPWQCALGWGARATPRFSNGNDELRVAQAARALETTALSTQDSLNEVQELVEILESPLCKDLLPDLAGQSISLALESLAGLAKPEFNGVFIDLATSEKTLKSVELSKIGAFAQKLSPFLSANALRKDLCDIYEIQFRNTDSAGEDFIRALDTIKVGVHTIRDLLSVVPGMTYLTVASEMIEDASVEILNTAINETIDFFVKYKDTALAPYYTAALAGKEYNYSQRGILSGMLWASQSDKEIEEKINEFVVGNQKHLKILPELRQEIIDMGTHWYTGNTFVPFWGSTDLLKTMDDTLDWIEKYGTASKLKEFVAMQKPRLQEMRQQQLDAVEKGLNDIIFQELDSAPDEKEGVDPGGELGAGNYTLTLRRRKGFGRVSVVEVKLSGAGKIPHECDLANKDSCTFSFSYGARVLLLPHFEGDQSQFFHHAQSAHISPDCNYYNATDDQYCFISMNENESVYIDFIPRAYGSDKSKSISLIPLKFSEEFIGEYGNIIARYVSLDSQPYFHHKQAKIHWDFDDEDIIFQASPSEGWSFVRWDGYCSGNSNICTIKMDSIKNVHAHVIALFARTDEIPQTPEIDNKKEPKPPTLGINIIGKGHVFFDPDGTDGIGSPVPAVYKTEGKKSDAPWSFYFDKNSTITLTARAGAYWKFTGWDGACAHANNQNTCTITMDKAQSVSALFSLDDGAAKPPTNNPPQDKEPIELGNGCQAREFSAMEERVQDAYIALYGRPADVDGLAYWSSQLQAAGGDINAILDDFIDPNTEEYRIRFSGKDDFELLDILYKHLFGPSREIDPDGFIAYLSDIFQGTFKLTSTAIKVVDGVPHDSSDWAELEARRKLARHYVTIMEAMPGGDTDVILADYQEMLHGMENVDAVCNALSQAVFPATR